MSDMLYNNMMNRYKVRLIYLCYFVALKLIPSVPKFAALPACGASLKTSLRQVMAKSLNPHEVTSAASSSSRRAPAIQPVHRSIFRLALSGTSFCTMISAICSRPPGVSTRYISCRARVLSGARLKTPLEIITSAQ